jgi:hypothetical protein
VDKRRPPSGKKLDTWRVNDGQEREEAGHKRVEAGRQPRGGSRKSLIFKEKSDLSTGLNLFNLLEIFLEDRPEKPASGPVSHRILRISWCPSKFRM